MGLFNIRMRTALIYMYHIRITFDCNEVTFIWSHHASVFRRLLICCRVLACECTVEVFPLKCGLVSKIGRYGWRFRAKNGGSMFFGNFNIYLHGVSTQKTILMKYMLSILCWMSEVKQHACYRIKKSWSLCCQRQVCAQPATGRLDIDLLGFLPSSSKCFYGFKAPHC
jgi:hypothetical protein